MKKSYIETRVIDVANFIINKNATIRETAKKFGISKSTVYIDITDRLININKSLANQVKEIINYNKSERHIRGGLATKEKYLNI